MKSKSIKDAIHGYINLDEPFWKIIDTAEFQRLKWIEQTSFRVLFPSARHDRFIHSIGVYHLGQKALKGFLDNCSSADTITIQKNANSFLLACLIHDIGHAPFSHTCESLYNYKKKITDVDAPINKELFSEMDKHLQEDEFLDFKDDYSYILSSKGKSPSEHEVMSAIIACQKFNEFREYFPEKEKTNLDLNIVVRAIIGCCFKEKIDDECSVNRVIGIKNCLIRLLNSATVDVDKLDYIARDTQMSGYDNIVLDTDRLLSSVCIVCSDNVYYPSFKKSAMSVIKNVVVAKNAQAKWVVNHPVVIYEAYLLKRAIGEALKYADVKKDGEKLEYASLINFLFSSNSLSKAGNEFDNGTFTLLSDIEILALMKQKQSISNAVIFEYFARNERKKPIWKSHEEFIFSIGASKDKVTEFLDHFSPLISYLNNIDELEDSKEINDSLYDKVKLNKPDGFNDIIKILDILKNYRREEESDPVEFNYVILSAKDKFSTKIHSEKLFIRFGENERDFISYKKLEEEHFEFEKPYCGFFYLYSNTKINPKHFLEYAYAEVRKAAVRM